MKVKVLLGGLVLILQAIFCLLLHNGGVDFPEARLLAVILLLIGSLACFYGLCFHKER